MDRPNYILLLELDPDERDPARIEAAIKKKQGEWSREKNHATKGRAGQQNLELLKDIAEVMNDAAARDEEAEDAVRQFQDIKKQALRELDDVLKVIEAAGSVSEKTIEKQVKRFAGRLTEKEIRARIKVPIGKEGEKKNDKPTLPKSLAKQIATQLAVLKKEDLYDFLAQPDRPLNLNSSLGGSSLSGSGSGFGIQT